MASASTTIIGRGPLQAYTFTLITSNPRPELLTSRSSIYALGLSLDSSPSLVKSLLCTATFSGSFYTGSLRHIDAVDIIHHKSVSGYKLCLGVVLCSYAVKLVSSSLCDNLTRFFLLINLILHSKSPMSPATLIDNHYAVTCCSSLVVITVGVSRKFYICIFAVCAEIMFLKSMNLLKNARSTSLVTLDILSLCCAHELLVLRVDEYCMS